jgi:hypothetical protein
MLKIPKKYIVDENNRKIAVQISMSFYNKIEKILEDYALGRYISESRKDRILTLHEAKKLYKTKGKAL